jgi:Sulfate permease and related transporters (MFS superfamily)
MSGIYLLILILVLDDLVRQIPMAALVAVMIMVSIGTFSWSSIKNLRVHNRTSSAVMLATVLTTVFSHNLALGVGVGVLLSALFFAYKISQFMEIDSALSEDGRERIYSVRGQVFFVTAARFAEAFDCKEVLDKVVIDVSQAHLWDLSSIDALDRVVLKFRREGTEVDIRGMNEASRTLVLRIAKHDKPGAMPTSSCWASAATMPILPRGTSGAIWSGSFAVVSIRCWWPRLRSGRWSVSCWLTMAATAPERPSIMPSASPCCRACAVT